MVEIQRIGEPDFCVEKLDGGFFENVDFHRAVLNWQSCRGAYFRDVSLRGVFALETDFTGARFERCSFFNARLERANFTNAVFEDCSIVCAMMQGADLRGANLSTCDLSGVLQSAPSYRPILIQLAGSIYDETTEWPKGFDPEKYGAIDGTQSRWQRPTE